MNKRIINTIMAAGIAGITGVLCGGGATAAAAVAPVVSTLSAISEGSVTPVRVATDQFRNYYVTDPRGGGVLKYNSAGGLLQKIATTGKSLFGIAVAQNGDVLVSQGSVVAVYNSAGTYRTSFGTFGVANGIALDDKNGAIYVVDSKNNNVQVFNADYTPAGLSFGSQGNGAGQFRQPTGISFEKVSRQLAVVDTLNGRVQFFNSAGAYQKTVGSFGAGPLKFTSPQGIAFEYSADGNTLNRMYVVDSFQATIQVIDAVSTSFLRYVGSYGFRTGQLATPGDILLDSFNRLLVPNGTGSLVLFAIEGGSSPATGTPAVTLPSSTGTAPPALALTAPASLSTVNAITLSGTVEAGAVVSVNGVAATVTGTNWTAPVTLTQQGLNSIVVTATTGSGVSSVNSYVTLDSVAPVFQEMVVPKTGSVTNSPIQTISGVVADSTATNVTVTVGGVSQVVPVNDGVFSATVKLAGGSNTVMIAATDAGGQTTSTSSTVTYSPLAPALALATPAGAVSNSASYVVSGSALSGATVTVNGVPATVTGTSWTATIPLATGLNPLTVTETVAGAGATSTLTSSVVYAPDMPQLKVTTPVADTATARKNVVIAGKAEAGATVTALLDGNTIPVAVAADGSFTVPLSFAAAGTHAVAVTSISAAGVIASTTRTVVYDPAPPQFTVLDTTPGTIKVTSSNGVVVARDKNGIIATASNGSAALDLTSASFDQSSLNIEVLTATGLSSRDGRISLSNGDVDIADALLAAQMSLGMATATFEQKLRGDVGPLVNHVSVPDGKISLDDVMLILQKAIGLEW